MSDESEPVETSSQLQIIVDTSVLRQARGDLGRGNWPVLLAAARLGLFKLRLPAVVLQEAVEHRRRDLVQLMDTERKVSGLRDQLLTDLADRASWPAHRGSLDDRRIDRLCNDYADSITSWFEEAGSVLNYPSVTHDELVRRVLDRKRPFTEGERGYRDALIWYSALECAGSGSVILLTANTKDFAKGPDGDYELADDLVADLEAKGLPRDRVRLTTTTSALLRAVLPEWDDSRVQAAWSAYLSSDDAVETLDSLLDERLGHVLTTPPPDAPPWLWSIGLRSIAGVTSVKDIQTVDDSNGWYRVHARMSCMGRLGGYAWAWGDPDADTGDFSLWDDWGGLTGYYASASPVAVDVELAARFRPLLDVEQLSIVGITLSDVPARGAVDQLSRVNRALVALRLMLTLHLDNADFLADVVHDRADEFELMVGGVIADWEEVANAVPGRYPALASDNLATVLHDAEGLRALRRDLSSATDALEVMLATGPPPA